MRLGPRSGHFAFCNPRGTVTIAGDYTRSHGMPITSTPAAPGWAQLPPELVDLVSRDADLAFPDLLAMAGTAPQWHQGVRVALLEGRARAQVEANEGAGIDQTWPGRLCEADRQEFASIAAVQWLLAESDNADVRLLLDGLTLHSRLLRASPADATYRTLPGLQLHDGRVLGPADDPRFLAVEDGAIAFVRPDGSRSVPQALAGHALVPNTREPQCTVVRCMATRPETRLVVTDPAGAQSVYDVVADKRTALPAAFTDPDALAAVSANGRYVAAAVVREIDFRKWHLLVVHDAKAGVTREFPGVARSQLSVLDSGEPVTDYGYAGIADVFACVARPRAEVPVYSGVWRLDPGADCLVAPDGRYLIRHDVRFGEIVLQDMHTEGFHAPRLCRHPADATARSMPLSVAFSPGKRLAAVAYREDASDPTVAIYDLADSARAEYLEPKIVVPLQGGAMENQRVAVWFDPDGTAVNALYALASPDQGPATGVMRLPFPAE